MHRFNHRPGNDIPAALLEKEEIELSFFRYSVDIVPGLPCFNCGFGIFQALVSVVVPPLISNLQSLFSTPQPSATIR